MRVCRRVPSHIAGLWQSRFRHVRADGDLESVYVLIMFSFSCYAVLLIRGKRDERIR